MDVTTKARYLKKKGDDSGRLFAYTPAMEEMIKAGILVDVPKDEAEAILSAPQIRGAVHPIGQPKYVRRKGAPENAPYWAYTPAMELLLRNGDLVEYVAPSADLPAGSPPASFEGDIPQVGEPSSALGPQPDDASMPDHLYPDEIAPQGLKIPELLETPINDPEDGAPPAGPVDEAIAAANKEQMIIEAIRDLDPESDYTSDGKPSANILTKKIGTSVTAAERDAAWQTFQEERTSAGG